MFIVVTQGRLVITLSQNLFNLVTGRSLCLTNYDQCQPYWFIKLIIPCLT